MEQLLQLSTELSVWLWIAIMTFIFFVIPVARILKRTGHHPLWSLAFLIPIIGYLGLWIFAFKRWPAEQGGRMR